VNLKHFSFLFAGVPAYSFCLTCDNVISTGLLNSIAPVDYLYDFFDSVPPSSGSTKYNWRPLFTRIAT